MPHALRVDGRFVAQFRTETTFTTSNIYTLKYINYNVLIGGADWIDLVRDWLL
jgi:hypothetical protein